MEFSEELIEEIAARLRSLCANFKKTQNKNPESKINLEFYDPETENNIPFELKEVPDASIILEELEFPKKIKIDLFVDGTRKKTLTLFELKEEKQTPQSQNIPNYPYPNQSYTPSPDFREIMTGLERMVGSFVAGNKETIDQSLRLQKETISEMKNMMVEQISAIKMFSDEKVKFENNQRTQSINSMQEDYQRKLKLETENFTERLTQEKEHQQRLRDLEVEKAKLSKDSSSKYVDMASATVEITKAVVEAAREVVPAVMETMQAVKAAQAMNITPTEIPAA